MLDKLGRDINYLRISLTDRCNLRCRYCMPDHGLEMKEHYEILSLEEIERLVRIASEIGISKVRLTGGEPLIRRNLTSLVKWIAGIASIDDIALTTNGLLLPGLAKELKMAGLNRVNISLDTLKKDRYQFITRGGELKRALDGLEHALEEGLNPVKLNTVVIRDFNDDEILDFCDLAYQRPIHVRFIEFMPIGEIEFWEQPRMIKTEEIKTIIEQHYQLQPGKPGKGNGPAKYYILKGGRGSVGFISPMSNHFCHECNRLRLTADGRLRGCLYYGKETDLKEALRSGASDQDIRALIIDTIESKPAEHHMGEQAWGQDDRKMYQIGG
ncbi:MAG: GTP 3',8-cyclase MoaA [Chitinophagales bacterium]